MRLSEASSYFLQPPGQLSRPTNPLFHLNMKTSSMQEFSTQREDISNPSIPPENYPLTCTVYNDTGRNCSLLNEPCVTDKYDVQIYIPVKRNGSMK